MKKISIVIADDHPVFRKGLMEVISSEDDMIIIAEAKDGESAVKTIKEKEPDIALVDVSMPKLSGFDVVREIKKAEINTQIIFLTMHNEETLFKCALDLGINGYLLKESALENISKSIRTVNEGNYYFSPGVSNHFMQRNINRSELLEKLNKLTRTEKQILKLIAEKKTSKEIGDELFISKKTVENHRTNICSKLDLHGTNSLLKFAMENKHLY